MQCHAGQERSDQFVDQYAEQDDIADQSSLFSTQRLGGHDHAQGHTGLREQGNAQVFADGLIAMGPSTGQPGAEIFAQAAEQNVGNTDQDDAGILEHGQFQAGAADDEKGRVQRSRPTIRTVHDVGREFT